MIRMGAMVVLSLLIGGCATGRGSSATEQLSRKHTLQREQPHWGQESLAATALVFDPPIAHAEPPVHLPRANRQPSAFIGYDELTTTFFFIRVDDRHTSDWTERYERRAVIEQVGARHR